MVKFGNEHGGHTVECGATLLVDRCQGNQRIKTLHNHLGTSVGKAVHGGQNHAEAVEQRHAYAQFVILGELHVLTCQESVIGNVIVGKHDSLGESCGTRCILHIDNVVAAY